MAGRSTIKKRDAVAEIRARVPHHARALMPLIPLYIDILLYPKAVRPFRTRVRVDSRNGKSYIIAGWQERQIINGKPKKVYVGVRIKEWGKATTHYFRYEGER